MGILIQKQKGMMLTYIARLSLVAFMVALAFSFTDTIWAVYLDQFLNSATKVGYLSSFLTFISFLCFFLFIPLIEKSSKSKIYSYSLLGVAFILFLFSFALKFWLVILLAILVTIMSSLRITSYGLIIRDKSPKKYLSRNEGLTYTFMNSGWLIGPLIAGFLSEKFGYGIIFLLASILIFLAFFLFKIFGVKDSHIQKRVDSNFFKNFISFFKDKNRATAYILGGGVNFWWSLIYLFMPIFIFEHGLGNRWIGYFLFAISLPLILFSYKAGRLAGKVGFKKMFKIGFFIPFFLSLMCFFFGNIYIIMGLLILSSIGLAMLESTTEAYFFDVLKGRGIYRYYGPYNTTIDLNHFVGRLLSATLLLFLPFKFVFLFFSFFMFLFFLISFRIKDVVECKKT